MSAFDKEKVFVELRKYHLNEFPKSLSTPRMASLLEEYKSLEDSIVSMIFGLVNGKTEFVDFKPQLVDFNKKLDKKAESAQEDKLEEENKALFLSKSVELTEILNIAESGDFKLRPQRKPKIIRSTNPREIIEN